MNHTRKFHVHVCPETSKLLQSLAFKRGHLWGIYGQTFQYLDGKTLIFNCFSPLQLGFVERKALKEENWYGISTLLSLEDALVELLPKPKVHRWVVRVPTKELYDMALKVAFRAGCNDDYIPLSNLRYNFLSCGFMCNAGTLGRGEHEKTYDGLKIFSIEEFLQFMQE